MKLRRRTKAALDTQVRTQRLDTLYYYAKHYFYRDPDHPMQRVLADPALDLGRLDKDLRKMTDIVLLNDEVDTLLRDVLAGRPSPLRFVSGQGFEMDLKGLLRHSELPVTPPGLQ